MIPREILKKIRQIELRTNRIVTGFAPGARLCEPQHSRIAESQSSSGRVLSGEAAAGRRPALRSGARASARFTARTPAASKTNPALNSIRTLKRRERRAPIPTGLCPPAQGCEAGATLGQRPQKIPNRNAVAAILSSSARGIGHNPVGVRDDLIPFTQGSSCVATLGYMPESRWDSLSGIANETLARRLFQSPPQFRRIPCAMKNGSHIDGIQFNRIVNAVFAKFFESHFVSVGRGEAKSFRELQNLLEGGVNFPSEFFTQAGTLCFIPCCRVFKFQAGKRRENDSAFHALRLLRRSWSSACTVSHGMPRSGCCRSSSARRSNSASCSGVGSASNFSRSCSKTSRCSSNGSFSTCSMICAALMAAIYSVDSRVQAGVFACLKSPTANRQSPIPP